ncbi:hypothetical protein [Nocardioides humi]|uniref:hypothetical protein n=1 Tax=Nocardioides humi TaxID=449461 RepID=UPI0015E838F2|nr:hypothetical protein [Nocardioides humi]
MTTTEDREDTLPLTLQRFRRTSVVGGGDLPPVPMDRLPRARAGRRSCRRWR